MRGRYWIMIGLVAVAMVLVVVLLLIGWNSSGILSLRMSPDDSIMVVDGKNYSNGNDYSLPVGSYVGTIERENFEEKRVEFTISKDESTIIVGNLVPANRDFSVYEANYNDMYYLMEYANSHPEDIELTQFVESYLDKINSMADLLPISYTSPSDPYDYYNILNGSSKDNCAVFCIYIEASTPNMYEDALMALNKKSK